MVLLCPTIFVIPAIIGGLLVFAGDYRGNLLARMAGVLTLKPIVATPLVILLAFLTYSDEGSVLQSWLLILPGVALTFATLLVFQDVLKEDWALPRVGVLIVLDCLRWLNTALGFEIMNRIDDAFGQSSVSRIDWALIAAFVLPTLYAFVALWIARSARARLKSATPKPPA